MIERTLVLIKPDGLQRGLVGAITSRFEHVGLKIVAMELRQPDKALVEKHYQEHQGKSFYPMLEETLLVAPVVAMVLEGISAVALVRKLVGATEPAQAAPGTIRGDNCQLSYEYATAHHKAIRNTVHASANREDAEHEVNLWFGKDAFVSYSIDSEEHHR